MLPTVAIIGRPNVGKSTLFNRLVGKRLALVDDRPGVTRDRREGQARLAELKFRVLDTAGLEDAEEGSLAARMSAMSEEAMDEADVALFMIDARAGLTPEDEHFARLLRRKGKPVIVLANKAEGKAGEAGFLEAWSLGLGDPIAFSAAHGQGLDELYDRLAEVLPRPEKRARAEEDGKGGEKPLRLAIMGRPNAGKSTLINRLLGTERMLTGPEAGITRDAIGVDWQWKGRPVKLWDTAGMRKKAKVKEKLEKLSVSDGLRAAKFAEVVVLLLDATQPLEKQDLVIANLIAREGRAIVIALNKWDLVKDKAGYRKKLERAVDDLLPQIAGAPVITLSALTGQNVDKLMPEVFGLYEVWNKRLPTAKLNQWLREATERHPPPAPGGRRIRIRYITQPNARPPLFRGLLAARGRSAGILQALSGQFPARNLRHVGHPHPPEGQGRRQPLRGQEKEEMTLPPLPRRAGRISRA